MENKKSATWFDSTILKRERLTAPQSGKKTYHVELCLENSEIEYDVGDCLKILPHNCKGKVDALCKLLNFSGDEQVCDKEGHVHALHHFLSQRANIDRLSKKTFTYCLLHTSVKEDEIIGDPSELKEYLSSTSLMQFLQTAKPTISPQPFIELLAPLLPRYYSIASSMRAVGKQAHLTVAAVGVASDYLCGHTLPLVSRVQVSLHKSSHFGLSEQSFNHPIIMIGPGTGIAPFRGFLQEREHAGLNQQNWLFFGERTSAHDFYYQEYLEDLQSRGLLKLDCAFSRDRAQKVYVQDKMYQERKALWQWLEAGAYIYVCGDKARMAKSVDQMLQTIIEHEGKQDPKQYISNLKKQKRYLRDVY